MKLSDFVVDFIARQGVGHVFMLPGGGAMHLNDSLGRSAEVQYVCNLHEQACAIAADAYAQFTGNLGVAMVTTGPGGTNALTGVAGSWLDSIPVMIISGQVKRADMVGERGVRQMGFQEIDITAMARPITKYAVTVTDPNTIRYHLEKAAWLARHGRPGPVWIDIPLDVQAAEIDASSLGGFENSAAAEVIDSVTLRAEVSRAISLFNRAERPAILVGNGTRLGNAYREFIEVAEILRAPVLTTWKTVDFLADDHALYAGRPGAIGQRGANFTQQNSDWLLCIGARLDLGQTGYSHKNFARAARKVVVDVDQAEIDKLQMPLAAGVCADAGAFLRECLAQRGAIEPKDRSTWLGRAKAWQEQYPVILPEYWDEPNVNTYALIEAISDELSGDDLVVPGSSGACSEITMQSIRVKPGLRIFNSEGLGSMGFGVAAAIGGCLASGCRRTIAIEGDGGFIMNVQELATVGRLALPIKFFVLNNDGYASIRSTQRSYFAGRYVASGSSSGLTLPDFTAVGRAFGLPVRRIVNHGELRAAVREVLNQEGPVLCEVVISPAQVTAPRITSRQREDGTMVSSPLEDMAPLLSREEFMANMLIPPVDD